MYVPAGMKCIRKLGALCVLAGVIPPSVKYIDITAATFKL